MSGNLFRFLNEETAGAKLRLCIGLLTSGLTRWLLLALVNSSIVASAPFGSWRSLVFLVLVVIHLASAYYSLHVGRSLAENIAMRLRLRLVEKLLRGPLRFIEVTGTSELYTSVEQDVARLTSAAMAFIEGIHTCVLVACALAYLGWLSMLTLVVVLAAIGSGVVFHLRQERMAISKLALARTKETEFFAGIEDSLHGFKELKQHGARRRDLMTQLTVSARDMRDLMLGGMARFLLSALTSTASLFILIGLLIFVLAPLAHLERSVTFQLLSCVLFLVGPVESLVGAMPTLASGDVSLSNLQRLERSLDSATAQDDDDASARPFDFQRLTLRNILFRFEGIAQAEGVGVGPISLDLRRGEVLFVVGGNGSGKTTLMKLLTGLYAPLEGQILLDDRPVDSTKQAYREMFATVFSDFHLFQKLYGIAAQQLHLADELLAKLQLSHKTRLVGSQFLTTRLSAGQRRRLAYAVARLCDRQIYVLDELTADQDPIFREYFYRELLPELRGQGKTVVVVTHDDRYLHAADRVVKLDSGMMLEASPREPDRKSPVAERES